MASDVLKIYELKRNVSSQNLPVYGTTPGVIGPNEIFSVLYSEFNGGDFIYHISYYNASKGFSRGWLSHASMGYCAAVYTPEYGYYEMVDFFPGSIGDLGKVEGYKFQVRRKCRIFKGTKEITSIYPGDAILTDGMSNCGASYSDRLSIRLYRKNGKWYDDGEWCDTDTRIGKVMPSTITVYSTKW